MRATQYLAFFVLLLPLHLFGYDTPEANQGAYREARRLESQGHHYAAALHYFNSESEHNEELVGRLTENLSKAKLWNTSSYFFIKTLQTNNKGSIKRVLPFVPQLMQVVGGDLLRKYILRHTNEGDYDTRTKNHFYYFLGKDNLLKGDTGQSLQALSKITSNSLVYPEALYLKGVAQAILGQTKAALESFRRCQKVSDTSDLEARCTASLARSYYQAQDFEQAENVYDEIPKSSFVWTDILFEQAWNAYAKGDYNRTLGKLVTYRSPNLAFVFNPEVDVLKAQSFYALCLYEDVYKAVQEFNSSYGNVGLQIKQFLLTNDQNLGAFYNLAKEAFRSKLHTQNLLNRALNRFIRGPYFANFLQQEKEIKKEAERIKQLASNETPHFSSQTFQEGFGGFLEKILNWRSKTIRLLGGLFVKNSMLDLYSDLLADFDKMSFIKLEMLKHTKQRLQSKIAMSEDEDGVLKKGKSMIDRKDHQYFWTFNGEFWSDELGDYVFALESECGS